MEFHDQIVMICGGTDEWGPAIAEGVLRRGAQTVIMVGALAGGASSRVRHTDEGELICLSEDALDRIGDDVDGIGRRGRIDAVINLIALAPPHSDDRVDDRMRDPEIAAACDAVVCRITRIVNATGDLLRESRPCSALVNVGWWAPEAGGGMSAATAAASGSLDLLTKSLAKTLAPQIRVNAVLSAGLPPVGGALSAAAAEGNIRAGLEDRLGPVLFLASSAARHMTGTVLVADAGRSLGFAAFSKRDDQKVDTGM